MNATRISYAGDELAVAMLPLLLAQSRIDRTDEHAQATEILARAIGRIERQCGIAIAPQEWAWIPRTASGWPVWNACTEWQLSEIPVRGFSTIEATDANGVAFVDFSLVGNTTPAAFAEVHVTRPNGIQTDDAFAIVAGWATPADMPAELRDTVIRYAASLWEFREAWSAQSTDTVPEWVSEGLGIFWVPRV